MPAFNCASLVCKRDVDQCITSVRSFLLHCQNECNVTLFDDGSLDKSDIYRLQKSAPNVTVLQKSQRESLVLDALCGLDACVDYRKSSAMGIKLFDIPIHYSNCHVFYFDSDILFFRPFTIDSLVAQAASADIFMSDSSSRGYSSRLVDLKYRFRVKPYAWINAGFYCITPEIAQLQFAEWFLSKPRLNAFPFLSEQTIWASGKRTWKTIRYVSPKQMFCPNPCTKADCGAVALHFISPVRSEIRRFISSALTAKFDINPKQLATVKAKAISLTYLLAHRLRLNQR